MSKKNLIEYAGIFKQNSKEWKHILKELEKERKNIKLRKLKNLD
jgi:hypothetical protein